MKKKFFDGRENINKNNLCQDLPLHKWIMRFMHFVLEETKFRVVFVAYSRFKFWKNLESAQ